MNFTFGLPVRSTTSPVHLVRREELDPLGPDALVLAHRDPDVGVEEVDARHTLVDVLGQREPGAGLLGDAAAGLDQVLLRPQIARGAQPDVHAELAATDHQRVAHVVAGVAEVAVGDLAAGACRCARSSSARPRGSGWGGTRRSARSTPARRRTRRDLHRLLGEAAVLDPVEGPAEHSRGVLHRLLVSDLGTARAPGR